MRCSFRDAPISMTEPHRRCSSAGVAVVRAPTRSWADSSTPAKLTNMNRRNAAFWRQKEKP